MMLGHYHLMTQLTEGDWRVYRRNQQVSISSCKVGPNSIDVTLHPKLLFVGNSGNPAVSHDMTVDIMNPLSLMWREQMIPEQGIVLPPLAFCLGAVQERFECSQPVNLDGNEVRFMPMYDGRSTVGRLGIASHITAGFGDYGFSGAFTLELYNHFPVPVRLYAGMRIGQVFFEEVIGPNYYNGAYSTDHNDGPVAPVLGKDRFF